MNNIKEILLQKWQHLSQREKIILAAGSVFVLLSFFYLMLWSPLVTTADYYRQEVVANKMLLTQIEQVGPEISSLRSQIKRSQIKNQAELISVLEKASKKSRVAQALTSSGFGPQNTVRLQFDDVVFDDLVAWLVELQQKNGIVVDTFHIEKTTGIGHVRAQVTVMAV